MRPGTKISDPSQYQSRSALKRQSRDPLRGRSTPHQSSIHSETCHFNRPLPSDQPERPRHHCRHLGRNLQKKSSDRMRCLPKNPSRCLPLHCRTQAKSSRTISAARGIGVGRGASLVSLKFSSWHGVTAVAGRREIRIYWCSRGFSESVKRIVNRSSRTWLLITQEA